MSKENLRVLMLEDNGAECRLVEEMLATIEYPHFEMHCVATLAEANRALVKDRYDVLILDLGLRDSQGIETLKSLCSFVRHIPIVVLTMLADERIGLEAMQEGAQDYLVKTQVDAPLLSRALLYAIERAKTQDELRSASREWDMTFNAITDSIMLIDKDYRIKRVNKATFVMFDLPQQDIVGKQCHEVVHRMDKPWPDCPFTKTVVDLKSHATEIMNTGTNTWYLVSTSPIFDDAGDFAGAVHVTRDITELKKTERYLEHRIHDLEIFRKAAVDRELVMVQLKKKLREMEEKTKFEEGTR
ncbi:MAG TPA: response regulator [Candidatus Omnitrophota bacterium]|nr:response regulator [Candidatus Omnitrophota bacterium]HPT06592.1 response regulator [Candidatus Omnitrophota bacterium]